MRRNLLVLLLAVLFVPLALAEGPAPAVDPGVATGTVETVGAEADADLSELFAELDPFASAENKYMCMEGCTYTRECEMMREPASCPAGTARMCANSSGEPCAGSCVCY